MDVIPHEQQGKSISAQLLLEENFDFHEENDADIWQNLKTL